MSRCMILKSVVVSVCVALSILVWRLRSPESTALAPSIVNLGSVEPGFATVFGVPSAIIEPDIARSVEFRTSQLALFNGKIYASRRVLYRSFATPRVVLVLTLDVTESVELLQQIVEARRSYCARHGYGLYARYIQDFAADNKPAWEALGLAPARLLRQAMLAFPGAEWFWLLDSSQGEIQDPEMPLERRLGMELSAAMLPELELKLNIDATGHIQGERFTLTNFATDSSDVNCILSHDPQQTLLSSRSIIVRQSLKARALLETLTDPVMQEHEPFRRTNDHAGAALTHLARWHPLIVRSIALVPPDWIGTRLCDDVTEEKFACLKKSTQVAQRAQLVI